MKTPYKSVYLVGNNTVSDFRLKFARRGLERAIMMLVDAGRLRLVPAGRIIAVDAEVTK